MSVGVPTGRIGAEYPLQYGVQSVLGTAVAVTDAINQTANTLNYITGAHALKTAMGTRADEAESAQGETRLEGGFESNLRTATMRNLLKAYFGTATPSGGNTIMSVSRPLPLTIEDNWSGESHQYQDCMLDTLSLSCTTHLEFKMAWTVLGGQETLITSTTPSGLSTAGQTKAWADITGLTGLDVVPCQVSQLSINFANSVKLDYGAGQHAACAVVGGEFTINGTMMIRYDDANAAAVHAAYVAGTDLGPSTLTIGPTGDVHVLYIPNVTLLTCVPQKPLDDWMRLSISWFAKSAQNFTWTLPS